MIRWATIRVILKLIEEPQENSIYLQKTLAAAQVRITNHWTRDYHVGIEYVFEVSQQLKQHILFLTHLRVQDYS